MCACVTKLLLRKLVYMASIVPACLMLLVLKVRFKSTQKLDKNSSN